MAPLVIKEQGMFFVGGKVEFRHPNTTRAGDERYCDGHIGVNQMYVEYQIPEELICPYPLVMVHGGGHTGAVYRTTPDGREGWATTFLRRGHAVYVVDAPNRGRSGWEPTNRFAVSIGEKPPAALEPANIYSGEAAWKAFRWGPAYREQYSEQQFPIEHLDDYLKQQTPSYRTSVENDTIADGLRALVDRIGPSILLGWSTGTLNVISAAASRASGVKAIIAVEMVAEALKTATIGCESLRQIPYLELVGDYMDSDPLLAASREYAALCKAHGGDATVISLPEIGIRGNGHAMMVERNSEDIAEIIAVWISEHVTKRSVPQNRPSARHSS